MRDIELKVLCFIFQALFSFLFEIFTSGNIARKMFITM